MLKTKTEAAKVLLENGWAWEEVKAVLDAEQSRAATVVPITNPEPSKVEPVWYVDYRYLPTISNGDIPIGREVTYYRGNMAIIKPPLEIVEVE